MSSKTEEALAAMADDWQRDHDALTARVMELEAEHDRLREERDRYREGWMLRGRRINGVGEFADEGPWEPVKVVQSRMLHVVVEVLEEAHHERAAELLYERFPHLLSEDGDLNRQGEGS